MRVLRGTPDQLVALAHTTGDEHVKLVVESGPRAGLADELRARFPNAVEVALATTEPAAPLADDVADRTGRTPHELFADYLVARDAADDRVLAMFDELVDEVSAR